MASHNTMKCGDFRTTYEKDSTIFPTPFSRKMVLASIAFLLIMPIFADSYVLNLSIPAVKSRLHRARLLLRRQLGEYLGGPG